MPLYHCNYNGLTEKYDDCGFVPVMDTIILKYSHMFEWLGADMWNTNYYSYHYILKSYAADCLMFGSAMKIIALGHLAFYPWAFFNGHKSRKILMFFVI